jgi:hypothetical protein
MDSGLGWWARADHGRARTRLESDHSLRQTYGTPETIVCAVPLQAMQINLRRPTALTRSSKQPRPHNLHPPIRHDSPAVPAALAATGTSSGSSYPHVSHGFTSVCLSECLSSNNEPLHCSRRRLRSFVMISRALTFSRTASENRSELRCPLSVRVPAARWKVSRSQALTRVPRAFIIVLTPL